MCTLALIRGRIPGFPLVVAANRDEDPKRPSTPPVLWPEPVPFVGGRDEVAGGTWLGVNGFGLVVGLTNHWTGELPDPRRATRGSVVRELLGARDLTTLRRSLVARDPHLTNPFLLVAASREGEAFWTSSAEAWSLHPIEEPIFALGNQVPSKDRGARARRLGAGLEAMLEARATDPPALVAGLAARLGEHVGDQGPLESVCVHTERDYGTVSSSILLLGEDPAHDQLHHASGPPCTHPYGDFSELLRGLRAG